jgi:hypothetical protein
MLRVRFAPISLSAGVLALVLALPVVSLAGPPLLCFPFHTAGAPSLPWEAGEGWNQPRATYALNGLVADTLRLLTPETPVIARMETLRRATIYASRDTNTAAALMTALRDRALTRNHPIKPDPHAWFDFGYLVETYRQGTHLFKFANPAADVDGYRHIAKAITMMSAPDPTMELAAALAARDRDKRAAHYRQAQAAQPNEVLAKNLTAARPHLGL